MLTLKDSNQLRTMRNVKSYRAGATSTGMPMWCKELGRLYQEEVALSIREMHRMRRILQDEAARCSRELRRRWLEAAQRHRWDSR